MQISILGADSISPILKQEYLGGEGAFHIVITVQNQINELQFFHYLIEEPFYFAGCRNNFSGDDIQRRRFAGSVSAQKTDDFAGPNAEGQSIDGRQGITRPSTPRLGKLHQMEDVERRRGGGGG